MPCEADRFADAVLDGVPLPVEPADAVANLRVIERAVRGRRPDGARLGGPIRGAVSRRARGLTIAPHVSGLQTSPVVTA